MSARDVDVLEQTWRIGRKVGRTLYCDRAGAPDDAGDLIGVMDTRAMARLAALAPEMYRMLQYLQRGPCPFCGHFEHGADCELGALLARAEGR
jgi:hypothetical protein